MSWQAAVLCLNEISLDGGGGDLVVKSCPTLATLCAVACEAPLSMGLSRQEYWSGLPCPPPGDLPDSGTEPSSPALQADSLPLSNQGSPLPPETSTKNMG